MSNEIAIKPENLLTPQEKSLAETLTRFQSFGLSTTTEENSVYRAFALAKGIQQMRESLNPEAMNPIMSLQGSHLGFRTDRDEKGGYNMDTVRECFIAATLNGLTPVGNMFNIIAGRFYPTKEGFTYLLNNMPGLAYQIDLSVPVMRNGGAIVTADIRWSYNDSQTQRQTREIPVRVNAGMGADAILGKADRKAKKWLFEHITKKPMPDGSVDDGDVIDVPASGAVNRAKKPASSFLKPAPAAAPEHPTAPTPVDFDGDELPGLEPEAAAPQGNHIER